MDPHRPTFPLPPKEIRKEKILAFLTSKQVWLPFLVLAAAGIVVETPPWALLPLLALAFFVLALVWQARSWRLLGTITTRIVRRSNRSQDAALVARIRAFSADGEDGYAVTLGKFLEAKQAIEFRLHSEGKPCTAGGETVEKLVDSICFGVADSFGAVVALEKRIRALEPGQRHEVQRLRAHQKEHLTRVIDAYKAVQSALAGLDRIVRNPGTAAWNPDALDPAANTLEARVARLWAETRAAGEG